MTAPVGPLALHTWTLDTTPLADVLRIARDVGWDAIELRLVDFTRAVESGRPVDDVAALVKASGLPVACVGVEPGWMFAGGAARRRLLQVFAEQCRRAAALGCETVMSPVDKERGDPVCAAAAVREVGDIAAEYGVRLAIEFSGRSAWEQRALEDLDPGEIVYVQYSDVPRSGLLPGVVVDRLSPGRGSVPPSPSSSPSSRRRATRAISPMRRRTRPLGRAMRPRWHAKRSRPPARSADSCVTAEEDAPGSPERRHIGRRRRHRAGARSGLAAGAKGERSAGSPARHGFLTGYAPPTLPSAPASHEGRGCFIRPMSAVAPHASRSPLRRTVGRGCGARICHALWVLRLPLADEPDQRLEIIPTGSQEVTSPLTNLLDQSIDEHGLRTLTVHPSSSSHNISGVTTCGVKSPRRRLTTMRCAAARCSASPCRFPGTSRSRT